MFAVAGFYILTSFNIFKHSKANITAIIIFY